MKSRNRFQRGSGCYPCRLCKRQTRSTGRGDNENCELCVECFDAAGLENTMSDEGETPELLAEWSALLDACERKGGKLTAILGGGTNRGPSRQRSILRQGCCCSPASRRDICRSGLDAPRPGPTALPVFHPVPQPTGRGRMPARRNLGD